MADIPLDRKVVALRRVARGDVQQIAAQLGILKDSVPLLLRLLAHETDFDSVVTLVARIPSGTNVVFKAPLTRAMQQVRNLSEEDLKRNGIPLGAVKVLSRCEQYKLSGCGELAAGFLASKQSSVRASAARICALTGVRRTEGLNLLHTELNVEEPADRVFAVNELMKIPLRNDAERREREGVILSQLGSSKARDTLRVLTTCFGRRTVEALSPLMDGNDVSTALYSAWVLAQYPDESVTVRPLRRVVIFSMFHHQIYQAGAGIDFSIGSGVVFHQATQWLNSATHSASLQPKIPGELLLPLELSDEEQKFQMRAYRRGIVVRAMPSFSALNEWKFFNHRMDASYLSLMRFMAANDPTLDGVHVKGQRVAHFTMRKKAAEVVASLTGKPANYVGLTGDIIASDAVPTEPYEGQNKLVARYLLDRIKQAGLVARPQGGREWDRAGEFNRLLTLSVSSRFGPELEHALRAEPRLRQVDVSLANSGISFFQTRR